MKNIIPEENKIKIEEEIKKLTPNEKIETIEELIDLSLLNNDENIEELIYQDDELDDELIDISPSDLGLYNNDNIDTGLDSYENILEKIPEISKITNVEPKILIENMDGLIKIIKETNIKTVEHLDKLNQTIMRNGDIFKNILLKMSSGPIMQQSTSRYIPGQASEDLGPPPPPAIPLTADQKQARSVFQPPSKDDLAEMLKKLRKTKQESNVSSVGEGIRRKKMKRYFIY